MKLASLLFGFKGRINRQTWWIGAVGVTVAVFAISKLFNILAPPPVIRPDQSLSEAMAVSAAAGQFQGEHLWYLVLLQFFLLFVGFALGAKRCHDRNRSGWFQLLVLIPVLGWIWLLVELGFLPGTAGPNRYGRSPSHVPDGTEDQPLQLGET